MDVNSVVIQMENLLSFRVTGGRGAIPSEVPTL